MICDHGIVLHSLKFFLIFLAFLPFLGTGRGMAGTKPDLYQGHFCYKVRVTARPP